ncbi:hypothetical protein [Microbacterium oxydans]|uniref:hypothetical protein n=1 Tax=Microbacterium oxydans TaxID=82380 RepID=UPI000B839BDF|nr:hypothetical protein [Microbacterium oxydans]
MSTLKKFWILFASAAAVAGLYFGAAALKLEIVFWLIVALCALGAVFWTIVPWFIKVVPKIRNYDKLLQKVGRLQGDLDDARSQAARLDSVAERVWGLGYEAGIDEALGATLGIISPIPVLTQVVTTERGVSFLATTGTPEPRIGARYSIVAAATAEVRGVVEVIRTVAEENRVVLLCVRRSVPAYWEQLEQRAMVDNSVPTGTEIKHLQISRKSVAPSNLLEVPEEDSHG